MSLLEADQIPSILEPLSVDEFLANYWEKQTLHISRSDSHYFSQRFSLDDLEKVFQSDQFTYPKIQVTKAEDKYHFSEYANDENVIDRRKVAGLRKGGATLIWAQAQDEFVGLSELCTEVQRHFQLQAQANVYVSPPANQGFNAHFDSHDVFVLQVEGSKIFNIYGDGVALPFSNEKYDSTIHSAGALVESVELTPGDTLYIPRGVMHDAISSGVEDSLHVTLGVYAQTVRDLLHRVIETATDTHPQLRKSIERSIWNSPDVNPGDLDSIQKLIAGLLSAESMSMALSELRDEMAIQASAEFNKPTNGEEDELALDSATSFHLRPNSVLSVQADELGLKVRLHGRVLSFEEPYATAVSVLLESSIADPKKRFTVADLEKLTSEQSIALSKQLIHEKLIEIVI